MLGGSKLVKLFGLLVLIEIGSSCYIRTCDLGILGKRTVESKPALCRACGPGHAGQCYGNSYCCGYFGCYNVRKTDECQISSPTQSRLCKKGSSTCFTVPGGSCSANGFCCNSDTCRPSLTCVRLTNLYGEPEKAP
ncbi:AVP [Bugula neritina]|uniref:AVP n=1 Tax=Bugula neritina TaxID=10212 RepID=A0A7J7J3I1_BUGNE|nr:AVP [Bugula neritina]